MKKQALTTTEIETFAPGTFAAINEWRRQVSEDGEVNLSQPKTRPRATLDWFIDSFAIAGCAMAGVYLGAWLEAPDFDPDSVDTEADE
jgi:hypothetical protein